MENRTWELRGIRGHCLEVRGSKFEARFEARVLKIRIGGLKSWYHIA